MLSEKDQAMATDSMYKKFHKVSIYGSWNMRADRHINKHTDHNTSHPFRGKVIIFTIIEKSLKHFY